MKSLNLLIILILGAALTTPDSVSAKNGRPLAAQGKGIVTLNGNKEVIRKRAVTLDLAPFRDSASRLPLSKHPRPVREPKAVPPGQAPEPVITLDLFPDLSLEFTPGEKNASPDGRYTALSGKVTASGGVTGDATLVFNGGVVIGNIRLEGGRQIQLRVDSTGAPVAEEVDTESFDPPMESIDVYDEAAGDAIGSTAGDVALDDATNLDVMVVYTPAARAAAGGTAAMEALITLAVDETNQAYANSGVTQRLTLVHTAEVSYTEHTGRSAGCGGVACTSPFQTALYDLRDTSDGTMDNVHELRENFGADMVSLFIESTGVCGIAFRMATESSAFATSAFSVVDHACAAGNFSFAHELGHNQGLRHDRYVEGSATQVAPYAYGYVDTAVRFRTIMAYTNKCSDLGFNCPRVQYFSNPNVNYSGAPTGVAVGSPQAAFNALVLDETADTAANWRQSVNPPSGTLDVTLNPAGAVTAGAQWSADSGATWNNSGPVDLPVGTYTVSFKTCVEGYEQPSSMAGLSVTQGATTSANGTYTAHTDSVQVTMAPAGAMALGAKWRIAGCPQWRSSGDTITHNGSASVEFAAPPGWTAPATITGIGAGATVIAAGASTTFTTLADPGGAVFGAPGAGTGIIVNILPPAAVAAGARWKVNDPLGTENQSGDQVAVSTGMPYTLYFTEAPPWRHPAPLTRTPGGLGDILTIRYRASKPDFNGDGMADAIFRHVNGPLYLWNLNGTTVAGGGYVSTDPGDPFLFDLPGDLAGVGDFNGDGKTDLLFERSLTGMSGMPKDFTIWLMDNTTVASVRTITTGAGGDLSTPRRGSEIVAGVGDFNGDGYDDILLLDKANQNGDTAPRIVFISDGAYSSDSPTKKPDTSTLVLTASGSYAALAYGEQTGWHAAAVADFDGDGKDDILWRLANFTNVTVGQSVFQRGQAFVWYMDGFTRASAGQLSPWLREYRVARLGVAPVGWLIHGAGDFNGDGYTDLLLRYAGGVAAYASTPVGAISVITLQGKDANGAPVFHRDAYGAQTRGPVVDEAQSATLNPGAFSHDTGWIIVATGDYDGDGKDDVMFRYQGTGHTYIWFMDGRKVKSSPASGFTGAYAGAAATWQTQVMRSIPEPQ